MHNYLPKYFTFIEEFDKEFLEKLNRKIAIIYRNSKNINKIDILKKLKIYCRQKKTKLYIANDFKLARKLDCDGLYISAHNKKLYKYNINIKIKFNVIGSAHSLDEILIKKKQGTKLIFLSPLFFNKKNNKYLGISKFNLLSNISKSKIIALGGINNTNIKKLNMINSCGFAAISLYKNKITL